jgi:hypothetical protein
MERHCLRVYEIAGELGRRRGDDVDRELLLCAAWLHDAGLYQGDGASEGSYVLEGRHLVERVLAPFEWPADRLQRVGDAVERHHELRPQWARGTEVELMRRADLIDVSGGLVRFGLDRGWLHDLSARVPRRGMYGGIGKLVAHELRTRPQTLPTIFLRR